MMEIKNGGPAFPRTTSHYDSNEKFPSSMGMTLRDYFIAHAPADPQPWFEPTMKTERPKQQNMAPVEINLYSTGTDCINLDEIKSWDREYKKQRYIQWPAAWADAMLKARERNDY